MVRLIKNNIYKIYLVVLLLPAICNLNACINGSPSKSKANIDEQEIKRTNDTIKAKLVTEFPFEVPLPQKCTKEFMQTDSIDFIDRELSVIVLDQGIQLFGSSAGSISGYNPCNKPGLRGYNPKY